MWLRGPVSACLSVCPISTASVCSCVPCAQLSVARVLYMCVCLHVCVSTRVCVCTLPCPSMRAALRGTSALHVRVCVCVYMCVSVCCFFIPYAQLSVARVLYKLGRKQDADDTTRIVFEAAVKTLGPRNSRVQHAIKQRWDTLSAMQNWKEATAFRNRAAKLGCDVSYCH